MAKKLPGLSRRAPEMETAGEAGGGQAARAAKVAAEAKGGRGGGGKGRARVSEVSAHEGGREIRAEVLPPIGPVAGEDEAVRARLAGAREIVRRARTLAMVGGVLPIPFLDILAIAGVQLALVNELCRHYGVPFERNLAKSILAALVGSVVPYFGGVWLGGIVAKAIPLLGWGVGLAVTSVLAGATTQAMGVVFVEHFESGGTFLDFDPVATRAHYRREFEKAMAR